MTVGQNGPKLNSTLHRSTARDFTIIMCNLDKNVNYEKCGFAVKNKGKTLLSYKHTNMKGKALE